MRRTNTELLRTQSTDDSKEKVGTDKHKHNKSQHDAKIKNKTLNAKALK